jgi:NAD(P)-dependent dehydrogenase (short-subunit alcohol dehydrogenase family)
MLEHNMDRASSGDPERRRQAEQRYMAFTPAGRIADPAEAAEAVLWMCSSGASYLHGHSLILDGGMTSMFR